MPGVVALRKIQLGRESSSGTPVAATTIWRGTGLLRDDRTVQHVGEHVGYALPTTRAYIPRLGAVVIFDPVEATFQQLPHIFEAGIEAETPVQDGAGSDYIYLYNFPTTAENTIKTYTLEGGDNQLVQETDHAFVESFKITGNAAQGVMMSANWRGRDVVDTSFTGSLTVPALVPTDHIVVGGSKFYIDAVGGTLGATQITSTLLSFELDVTTGLKAKWTNLGKDFDFVYFDRGAFSAALKLVYEHNASADSQRDLYEAATPRQIRLRFEGRAFGTAGTTYSVYTFDIEAAGVYTEMPAGDVDGNATVEAMMQIGYDLTAALGLRLRVVNELSALP